jgi:hypothetical protein
VVALALLIKARVGWVRMNKLLKCTDAYGTYGIPKLSSVLCRLDGSYPTIPNECTME